MIAGFQDAFLDRLVAPAGEVEEHHGHVRFRWHLADGDGLPQLNGTDFGTIGTDGQLVAITGFFDAGGG